MLNDSKECISDCGSLTQDGDLISLQQEQMPFILEPGPYVLKEEKGVTRAWHWLCKDLPGCHKRDTVAFANEHSGFSPQLKAAAQGLNFPPHILSKKDSEFQGKGKPHTGIKRKFCCFQVSTLRKSERQLIPGYGNKV